MPHFLSCIKAGCNDLKEANGIRKRLKEREELRKLIDKRLKERNEVYFPLISKLDKRVHELED